MPSYNYEEAFALWQNGGDIDQIADRLGIPRKVLSQRQREMKWKRIASIIQVQQKQIDSIDICTEDLKANRARSIKEAEIVTPYFGRMKILWERAWEELEFYEQQFKQRKAEYEGCVELHNSGQSSKEELEEVEGKLRQARAELLQTRDRSNPQSKNMMEILKAIAEMQGLRYRGYGDLPNAITGERNQTTQQIAQKIYINMPQAVMKKQTTIEATVIPETQES